MKVTHEGSFILAITESGVTTTRESQCPQFVFTGNLVKRFDEEASEYEPWDEYDQQATGYLVLVDTKGNDLFNIENIGRAVDWDGVSFKELGEKDLTGVEVLVRIAENTYNEKTTLQVAGIDNKDADPIMGLRVMNAEELADLDKQYKRNKTKPQSTRNKPPQGKTKTPPKNPSTKGRKATPPKPPVTKGEKPPKNTTKAGPTTPPIPPKNRAVEKEEPKTATEAIEEQTGRKAITTKVECWNAVNAVKGEKFSDDDLLKAWDDGIAAIGNEDDYDAEDWDSLFEFVAQTIGGF
jgi:hypothetical protein